MSGFEERGGGGLVGGSGYQGENASMAPSGFWEGYHRGACMTSCIASWIMGARFGSVWRVPKKGRAGRRPCIWGEGVSGCQVEDARKPRRGRQVGEGQPPKGGEFGPRAGSGFGLGLGLGCESPDSWNQAARRVGYGNGAVGRRVSYPLFYHAYVRHASGRTTPQPYPTYRLQLAT